MKHAGLFKAVILALLSAVLLYLPWLIAALVTVYVLDIAGLFHTTQSVTEGIFIAIVGIILYMACRIIWSKLTIDRSAVTQLLERLNFDVKSNNNPIEATKDNLWVEITLDRSLMDYHPTPKSRIIMKDGESQIVRVGSYDPRYMYRLGTASFQRDNSPHFDPVAIKSQLENEYGYGVVKEILFQGRDLVVKLAVGTWLGEEMLLILEKTIGILSPPNTII